MEQGEIRLRRFADVLDVFVFSIGSQSFNRGTRPVIPAKRFLSRQSSIATCSSGVSAGVSTALRGSEYPSSTPRNTQHST